MQGMRYVLVLGIVLTFLLFQLFLVSWHHDDAPQSDPLPNANSVGGNAGATIASHKRKMIFSISSGRAGSHYLAKVLRRASLRDAIYAKSEPAESLMCCEYLKMVNRQNMSASYESRKQAKVSAINSVLATLPATTAYAETNHMFIKTFYDVVMNSYPDAEITVIILRRYLPEVLKSFMELGFLEEGASGWNWMHELSSPNVGMRPCIPLDATTTVFDKSVGYLVDIEAKAQRFISEYGQYPNLHKVLDVRTEALNNKEYVKALMSELGLTFNELGWRKLTSDSRKNQRTGAKKTNVSLEECSNRILVYLGKCIAQGITPPVMFAMESIAPNDTLKYQYH